MARGNEKTRCGGRMTESAYWSFVRSGLRQKSMRWAVKYDVLNAAKRPYTGEDKRTKNEYQCAICQQWFKMKEIEVDHIVETGSLKSAADLPRFVETLFCEADNLRVLCKNCHLNRESYENSQN